MTPRPKTLFYCQHVLGLGHLARSLELLRVLKDRHEIHFVHGGEPAPGFAFPESVEVIELPALRSGADFTEVLPSSDDADLAGIQQARRQLLLGELEEFDPDLVVIELFPFGRKKFAFELLPLLVRLRLRGHRARVACSLRDILVTKGDPLRFERRAVRLMNRYFDLLTVHTDPRFQDLGETFSRLSDLDCRICSTGYVSQPLPENPDHAAIDQELAELGNQGPLIVASAGGGRVGNELLEATILASGLLAGDLPHRLLVLAGVYAENEAVSRLEVLAQGRAGTCVRRHSERFLEILTRAQLSVSLAGYNTCMNLVTARVPALLLPFTGGNNNEQTKRAEKLAELEAARVLSPADLDPARLARLMASQLKCGPTSFDLDLSGARRTADAFDEVLSGQETASQPNRRHAISQPAPGSIFRRARATLERELSVLAAEGRRVEVFLRDDDVDEDEETLRQLLDLSIEHWIPLNLEVIPGRLADEAIDLLKDQWTCATELLEIHQHGFRHLNHEILGRKQEFGPSRRLEDIRCEIEEGRSLLAAAFEERFYPSFTPPWNRCTDEACRVLDELGFRLLSRDLAAYRASRGASGAWRSLREIPVAVDLHTWKSGPALRNPEEVAGELALKLRELPTVGLLLHHKVMDDQAFTWLDTILSALRRSGVASIHKLSALVDRVVMS